MWQPPTRMVLLDENVPVGEYDAATQMLNGEHLFVQVVAPPSSVVTQSTLNLTWPNLEVISVQNASGRLASSETVRFHLKLIKADSGEEIDMTMPDRTGHFRFSSVVSGLYFLRVRHLSFEGDIPLNIDPAAERSELDLSIGFSTCGLEYADNRECSPQAPLKVSDLCGIIVDPSGAIIPDSAIQFTLATDQATPSKGIRPRSDGTFEIRNLHAGQYMLRVSRLGFYPLQVPVHFQGDSGISCANRLRITLGVISSCSKVQVETR